MYRSTAESDNDRDCRRFCRSCFDLERTLSLFFVFLLLVLVVSVVSIVTVVFALRSRMSVTALTDADVDLRFCRLPRLLPLLPFPLALCVEEEEDLFVLALMRLGTVGATSFWTRLDNRFVSNRLLCDSE
jgi:hypothetical protein